MKNETTIPSAEEHIPVVCPECFRSTFEAEDGRCSCGWELPYAFVVPYDAKWCLEAELVELMKKFDSLRLMGKYCGKNPERLSELSHVKYLYLSRWDGFSFEQLAGFDNLNVLELDYLRLGSLAGVCRLPLLRSLVFTECSGMADISELSECRNLSVLNMSLCKDELALQHVGMCGSLGYFKYEGREIPSLRFVSHLRKLRTLIINARVTDRRLPSAAGLCLRKLLLKKSSFDKEDLASYRAGHPECEVTLV